MCFFGSNLKFFLLSQWKRGRHSRVKDRFMGLGGRPPAERPRNVRHK
jgi:hypothetical protein